MIQGYGVIRAAASIATDAVNTAVHGLREGRIQNEETFTDRMIGAIEESFRDVSLKGISWTAMTLTAHQRKAQESEFGADLLGVLDIDLADFSVQKGFLAQAKLIESKAAFSNQDFKRLTGQCEQMLTHTPDSFVFLYSRAGVSVAPAISVLGLKSTQNPHLLYRRGIKRFFEEHFESFIGDRRLYRSDAGTLDDLRATVDARRALLVKVVE